jgi:hypothetical protein
MTPSCLGRSRGGLFGQRGWTPSDPRFVNRLAEKVQLTHFSKVGGAVLALEADICGARFGRAPVAYRGTAPKRGIPFSGLQVVCPRVRERSPVALYGGHQFVRVEHVHVKDGGRPS